METGWSRYTVARTLGSGPTGTAYLCQDTGASGVVVVKELAPELTARPGFMTRFRTDVGLMSQVNSPNCIRVLDLFEQDARQFLVTEYVEGPTLSAVLAAGGLSTEQALGVLRRVLSGLGFAHAVGLLHRDLCPENVLVSTDGNARLFNFGQPPMSAPGSGAEGSPAYVSPEVIQGAAATPRSDIYSAGAMLYEALTGRQPFAAADPAAVLRLHVENDVPDPRATVPALAPGVAALVTRAMARDPAGRFGSALEFYQQLDAEATRSLGPQWTARASMAAAAGGAAAAAVLAPVPVLAAVPVAATVPAVVPAGAVRLRPLRALVGATLGLALVLGGTGFGATHGVLPEALAPAGFGRVGASSPSSTAPGAPGAAAKPPPATGTAAAAKRASSTVFVLDISGSMDSPAAIPAGFPHATELKQRQDEFESLIESARGHQKVPVGTIVTGVSGLIELLSLETELQTYLQKSGSDARSLSKLTAMKTATTFLLDTLAVEHSEAGLDNRAGIVTFADAAAVLAPVSGDTGAMKPQVDALTATSSTNIGDGLAQAVKLLAGQPAPAIVLMTDGWNNTGMTNQQVLSGPVAEAAARGIPVCAIGLGTSPFDVDQVLLHSIATRTGGGYFFVPDRVSLPADMQSCHHAAAGQQLLDHRARLKPGQTVNAPPIQVPPGKHRLTVTVTAPGNTFDVALHDAAGNAVGAPRAGAAGVAALVVADPPAGPLTVGVTGQQLDASSPDFFVGASTDGQSTSVHVEGVQAGSGEGPLSQDRRKIRLALTISAIALGLAIALISVRGFMRRMARRRTGRTRGTWLVPLVLYLLAIVGTPVFVAAVAMNLLWEVPLVPLPSF